MEICGWGRYPIAEATVFSPQTKTDCVNIIKDHCLIARGLGRSYGDSANSSIVLETSYLNHFIQFDIQSGLLTCEAAVSIREILQLTIPKGWFVPVTPGTSYITVGGAIASDVHGKNHHISGTFSQHVSSFDLMLGTGEVVKVSSTGMPDLFRATCGGMGLTGVILSATLQLKPIKSSQMIQTTIKANCLEEVCEKFDETDTSTYSVAWIDCLAKGKKLGRSLLMNGEHAEHGVLEFAKTKVLNIPFDMPSFLLNHYSIKAFNTLYYYNAPDQRRTITLPFEPYFYPLDSISNWNRLYGKKGFIQYQLVLPKVVGMYGLKRIFGAIVDSGKGSFLAVLKKFGASNENYLSFPVDGYTIALDFKMSLDSIKLIGRLDKMVVDMGGRIYLTKDALMSEMSFKSSYPQWEQFEQVREKYGAIGKFASHQSKRLGLQ